jgi:hypothetical protein
MSKLQHKSSQHEHAPERGALLTVAIILVVLHGAFFTALSYSVIKGDGLIAAPVLLGLLLLCSAATVVAGVAMWFWKRWGIYLYVVAGVGTAVVFLMRTGSIWMMFGAFLPLVIVGYILQPRLKYFS